MEKFEFTIKRINAMHLKDKKLPYYFILDEKNNLYEYTHQSDYVRPTLIYLEIAKPGDILEGDFDVREVHEGGEKKEIKALKWARLKETVSCK